MSKRQDLFLKHVGQTSPYPIGMEIQKAKGVYYYNKEGKAYFDFTSGIAVSNLGHQNKTIIKAIKSQLDKHLHTMVYGEFVEAPQVDLAQSLTSRLPAKLDGVYYCTSGSEAVEAAMKLAKRKLMRSEIISCVGSYHGSTHGALSIMGSEEYKQAYRPLLPHTSLIRYNHLEDIEKVTEKTAAVFIEVVQAATGVTPADLSWLRAIKKRCKKTKTLLVFDEIQTGFGRTGAMFSFEQYGVVPDMLLLAKAMGGGLPIGALVAKQSLLGLFAKKPILGHINTFGGNALACAASLAVLKVFDKHPELISGVEAKSKFLIKELAHSKIQKITAAGLLIGLHFKTKKNARKFMKYALEEGVVLIGFLMNDKAVRIAPPLTINNNEMVDACQKLKRALARLD